MSFLLIKYIHQKEEQSEDDAGTKGDTHINLSVRTHVHTSWAILGRGSLAFPPIGLFNG